MLYLLILGIVVTCSFQQETPHPRCDEHRFLQYSSPCTSCAAASAVTCPRGFRRITTDIGNANCSYTVQIGQRDFILPGCSHTCGKVVTERRCCPNFWGPRCLPCPSWSEKPCNWHGTCLDGTTGNGTCVCKNGFTGLACQECTNKNSHGEHCNSECNCVNGDCNSGPDGDGECYCQPPYSGPRCDIVSESCRNCSAHFYCKGEGEHAVCECLPGFIRIGRICAGVCFSGSCDKNADCSVKAGRFDCKCKEGYEGDGKVCVPVDPCAVNNGGCPADSTFCDYKGPGQAVCSCLSGMESSNPSTGCVLKSACSDSTCHSSAQCQTGQDGIPSCLCTPQQVGDGYRCYGTIMERIVELNHAGELTGAITLFGKGCELSLSQRGPFTALVPFLHVALAGVSESSLCKHHLILGQHLSRELEGNDIWTYSGETIRFKADMQFIFMRDPDTLFTIKESNLVASNGIIHIIDKPITNLPAVASSNPQFSSQTIGDILAENTRFNRFVSLVDNCGAPMPLRGPGPLTVFVPTNNAIDRFRDGSVLYMLSDARHKLQELLKHHMFSEAALTVDQLASMPEIHSMAKQVININITRDGRILLGEKGIPLATKDIIASNGVIHLIDGVLVPPSIVPILPHRCNVNESKIIQGPCVRCSYLFSTDCPPGSTEVEAHLKGCEAPPVPPFSAKILGCAKYCNVTKMRADCCKGFYGPDCKPCLGGFSHPCYDKGTCVDGIQGNGSCLCAPGFTGVACHICSDPNKHGENCDEDCHCLHGVCDNRPGSQGICRRASCLEGHSGDFCDKTVTPCNSDGVFEHCHINAYCTYSGSNTICVCRAGYEGDGHSCAPVNLCLKPIRGGCASNAQCVYAGPGNTSCVCNEGWTGDGEVCAEINSCLLENRGGCDKDAECVSTGPGQNDCSCIKGYMGDGRVCIMVNPCLKNNGGCHDLATCKQNGSGLRNCVCPENYHGDGITCYGSIRMELEWNSDYYDFYRLIQKTHLLNLDGNVTALVPSRTAFRKLSSTEETFWFDYYRLPHLLNAHFLDGIFSYEDLQQHVNQQMATLQTSTKWNIKNSSTEIMIENATFLVPDVQAVNGYIHIIDTVLRPPISALPSVPPDLMDFLNKTPGFSHFRKTALLFNLTDNISKQGHTLFIPFDSAIDDYLKKRNSTELDEDVFKYHIIPDEQIFPDHIRDGTLKSTLLGNSYQIMFHINSKNQTMANGKVPLNGSFYETNRGVVMAIPQVLEIHKNRCSKDVFLKVSGRCSSCDSVPRCFSMANPIRESFLPNMKPNCRYKKKVGTKRKYVPGCVMECLKKTSDHSCCSGYYGHECFKCPGKIDNWCNNNGKCSDTVLGTGECHCKPGFNGTACEICLPGRYGRDCKSVCTCVKQNGKCMDGIDGDGTCVCYKGWKGENCSAEVGHNDCEEVCDVNAHCISKDGGKPACSCVAGYEGNGLICKEINLCETRNGDCSPNANCTKINPGEKVCMCKAGYTGDGVICLEINPCLKKNGDCDANALCIKTGPNLHACICKVGYSGDGVVCTPQNPCWKDNGGCNINARCRHTGPGENNCTCYLGYRGDGVNCAGSISRELLHLPAASWFRSELRTAKIRDMYSKGPLTVFVPHRDYIENSTITAWFNASRAPDLLRYHIVGCEELTLSDLKSIDTVVAASGHELKFSVKKGVLYLNEDAKIIESDHLSSNGVIHFLDKILIPYDLSTKAVISPPLNVTSAAEAYGYSQFSKLLKDTNLVTLVENKVLQPFTMFWPSDEALNSLSAERKTWLYSEDHRDKLEAFMKAHMVRDTSTVAVSLPTQEMRSMYGTSSISISCDKTKIGKLLINTNEAKIMERHLVFDGGIAYGIDQLLEPPNLGARCDGLGEKQLKGRCGSCFRPPMCPLFSQDMGKTSSCLGFQRHYQRPTGFQGLYPRPGFFSILDLDHSLSRFGCRRECKVTEWTFRCCKNHYGMNCHVCPGGLEAPCGAHGDCHDGRSGTGSCKCHPGFKGSACELCVANHYGSNCTACKCEAHGKCDDGMDGSGNCFCDEGWTGNYCELKLESKPVCSPGCHPNAVCLLGNQCECQNPFEGDGLNCTAPDFCSEYNGGCHQHADCLQVGLNVTCLCKLGYSGDGNDCSPIDRCTENNGGCSDFATCVYTGPNERGCQCNTGYVGDGLQCLEKAVPPVDRCLEDNGGCHPRASCKDLHFHTKTAGVFHLRSPAGKYKMNFTSAEAACQAEGAMLATFSQLSDAQQLGMHMCVAGWMDGKKVGYPIRFPSVKCGDNRVGIILYKEPVDTSSTYDAYCYRMQDVECFCKQDYVGDGIFCNGNLASVLAMNEKFSTFYAGILRYATTAVEGENLMNFLLSSSSFATLFAPLDEGFSVNETLSWRDMEYHVSINHSIHFFNNMTDNLVIPSRLGCNLTIVVPRANATLSDNAKPKLVDKRRILEWDIPAMNGVIHIIEGPLKAPPQTVEPSPSTSQSGGAYGVPILVTLFVLLAAIGMAYYVFRRKNDAFRFQFFKNEDEGGTSSEGTNPALVSIPNPCYSGYTAFAEPFGDQTTKEPAEPQNPLE